MNNRKSKVKSKILLLIIIATLIAIIGGTYSRYTSTGTLNGKATMAKWSIKLKGDEAEASNISSASATVETTAQTVEGVSNANVSEGKIAPGQTLVSTVEVDPSGSQVAIDYNLEVNSITTEGFNDDSSIVVSKITGTVDGGTETNAALLGGKYVFFESLEDVLANKKVTFKTYISWTNGNNAADTENGMNVDEIVVPIGITAKQHLLADDESATADDTNRIETVLASGAVEAGDTLKIVEDIDYSDVVRKSESEAGHILNLPADSTVDLNSQTLKVQKLSIAFQGDNLTLKNGNIQAKPETSYGLFLWDDNHATHGATVENITVDGGICLFNAYDVVLRNVTATGHAYYVVYGNVKTTITIESGTYTAIPNNTALFGYAKYDNTELDENGNPETNPADGFKITGGTFYTNQKPLFHQAADHQNGIIYGGTFDCDVTAYLAPGKTCTPNGSGMWVVE